MFDPAFPVEFIGGSLDGAEITAKHAPETFKVHLESGFDELYERQNDEPTFVYLQIGYAKKESWPAR
jgi:hypothetical protein